MTPLRPTTALAALLLLGAAPPPARIFVSDETGNRVIVVEDGKVAATIAAGARPRGIRLSPDGTRLYVAVSGSPIAGPGVDESKLPPPNHAADGIAEIDVASRRVLRVLPVGSDPETFALDTAGATLFVSNEDASQLTRIDLAGHAAPRRASVGDQPEGVAVARDGRSVFVACEGADMVYRLDAATLARRGTVALAGRPRGLLASRLADRVYVSVEFAGKVAVLDARTGRLLRTIDLAHGDDRIRPMGMAEAADGTLFVATGRAGAVVAVDPVAGTVVRRYAGVGARLWGIALAAGEATIVTADGPSGEISLVDRATGEVSRIKVGQGPWGVATAGR